MARTTSPPVLVALAALLLGCVGSPSGPPACGAPESCAAGSTCVVGRCRADKGPPLAPIRTQRIVLEPEATAVVSSAGESGGGAKLPAVIALGKASAGSATLLLRFNVPISDPRDVLSAFLVLEPMEGAVPPGKPVPVTIAKILEPWSEEEISWGRHPALDVPERAGFAGNALASSLRLDVTHVVREWTKRRSDEHGLAILAEEEDPFGASYSLGVTGGQGPRLEVYVR